MAIYDLGTASLAANGEVTGVGTTWKAPLTLIRVGATIVFKTEPVQIYTISEIISDTQINVYNPNSENVPTGTGYAILAHDGITVQGLAQDVAETLRYYQSKETSIESLLQFIGQDNFDWPRFEQLANQSVTGAAEALASQIAAAESASTAVGARDATTAARDATIEAINSAGDAGTMVALAGYGIASSQSAILSSLDWQQFDFVVGASYRIVNSAMTNKPPFSLTPNQICYINVNGNLSANNSYSITLRGYNSSNDSLSRIYEIDVAGSKGSRTFKVRENVILPVNSKNPEDGGAVASRIRSRLDVYSKSESDAAVKSISSGGTGATTAAQARTNLDVYSKNEVNLISAHGSLKSYGADDTGVTPCDDAFDAMINAGRFNVGSGVYLFNRSHTIDISSLKEVNIDVDVEFRITSNINGFVFTKPQADFNANGLRIVVDVPGGGYSNVALTLRGSPYYTGPANFSRLSQKTNFGPFYVFNRQGAIKQEAATSPVEDEGYGFSIDCNSGDQEILIWTNITVSSTGFTNGHAIGVGTNPLNFISSLDLNLVSWFTTYHFTDNSVSQANGNTSGGIGDITVRHQVQPHAQMQKAVRIANGIGFMDGCRFDLTIWDPNLINYRAGIVDATSGNHYTNTMERLSYPITRAINLVDASIFPVRNFSSTIQDSNIVVSSSSEIAKYLYLSGVTPSMSLIDAFNAINDWCVANGVKSDFEFKLSLHEATGGIRSVFQPFLNAIQDDTGFLSLSGHYYSGQMSVIRVVYQVNPITSGGKIEDHEIVWNRDSNLVSHRLKEYTYGSTAEIRAKAAIQPVGFTTYDTTFNIPVWYNGTSWLKSDGSVAYTA